ncbi:MAG: tetratricopeptide repeat protein [Bacillota bacterium]
MREKDFIENTTEEIEEKYKTALEAYKKGRFSESRKLLKEIIEQQDDFVPAYNKLGVINVHQENLQQAEDFFWEALEYESEYIPSLLNIGNLCQKRGEKRRAEQIYQEIIDLDDEYGPVHNNLAALYKSRGDLSKAVKHMKKARKYGGLSHKVENPGPIYKEPGVIGCFFVFVFLLLALYFLL